MIEAIAITALSVFLLVASFCLFVTALDNLEEYKKSKKRNRL